MIRFAATVGPVRARCAEASGTAMVNPYPANMLARSGRLPRPEPRRDAGDCYHPYSDCDRCQNQVMNRYWLGGNRVTGPFQSCDHARHIDYAPDGHDDLRIHPRPVIFRALFVINLGAENVPAKLPNFKAVSRFIAAWNISKCYAGLRFEMRSDLTAILGMRINPGPGH